MTESTHAADPAGETGRMTETADIAAILRDAATALARLAALHLDLDEEVTLLRRRRDDRMVLSALPVEDVQAGGRQLDEVLIDPSRPLLFPTDARVFERQIREVVERMTGADLDAYRARVVADQHRRLVGYLPATAKASDIPDSSGALKRLAAALGDVPSAPTLPGNDLERRTLAALLIWADRSADDGYLDPRLSTQP